MATHSQVRNLPTNRVGADAVATSADVAQRKAAKAECALATARNLLRGALTRTELQEYSPTGEVGFVDWYRFMRDRVVQEGEVCN